MKYALPAILIIAIGLLIFKLTTDKPKTETETQVEMPAGVHTVVVDEVIQTSNYTYLKVTEKKQIFWIAAQKLVAKKGETYSFQNPMEMRDWNSKELDRTFDVVYFIQDIFRGDAVGSKPIPAGHQTDKPRTEVDTAIKVDKAEGGITVGELFANKKKYEGKKVIIAGKVVKVNLMVMGKNWIHIQDGTDADGKYDLTITSLAEVEEGQTITFEGVITLDKDFGAGYFYDVIMEEAEIKN